MAEFGENAGKKILNFAKHFWGFILLALFANFEVKFRRNGSKNRKTYFLHTCLRIPFCNHSGRIHYVKEGQIVVPYYTCRTWL